MFLNSTVLPELFWSYQIVHVPSVATSLNWLVVISIALSTSNVPSTQISAITWSTFDTFSMFAIVTVVTAVPPTPTVKSFGLNSLIYAAFESTGLMLLVALKMVTILVGKVL